MAEEAEVREEAPKKPHGRGFREGDLLPGEGLRGFWKRRSRRTKVRLVFYPSLVLVVVGFLYWTMAMPGTSHHGALPPLTAEDAAVARALEHDVRALATDIGERHLNKTGTLERARSVLEERFSNAGYAPIALEYRSEGLPVANIEATLVGTSRPTEIVVIGAHYDTASSAPGADDNASGVAALLAIMRELKRSLARTVRFVAFVNEEPPHFWNESMGSLHYAKDCRARNDNIVAMISLESLGYYRDERGSQKYPPVVSWFYPDRGDFVAFVGNTSSRSLVRESIGTFRSAVKFPSEGAAMPGFVTGVGWSDQWSFWQFGYPGVMVTDTAPFRNPGYHTPDDKPETLNYERLARVTSGLASVVRKLAQ